MSATNVKLSRILVAVQGDIIVASWEISGYTLEPWTAPTGRQLNRCVFELSEKSELDSLAGLPSPLGRRKNPVAFMQLRDVPGFHETTSDDVVDGGAQVQETTDQQEQGELSISGYALSVNDDGSAELLVPHGGSVLVRSDS